MIDEALRPVELLLQDTALAVYIRQSQWAWVILESLHFVGMTMLIGTVGMFDLRLLGFAKRVPVAALHRLIPVGIAGFLLNAATGFCFLTTAPEQYLFNDAFRVKVTLIVIAGLNVMFFYGRVFRGLALLPPGNPVPLPARIVGGVSLCAWVGVMTAGRLLTFFRPPF